MKFLFIKSFIEHDFSKIYIKLEIMVIFWLLVGIAIAVDFVYGVRRAKRLGIARTSLGFRKTVKKINHYGTLLTFSFLIDVLLSVWFYIPLATLIACAFLIFIEGRSVWESLEMNDKKNYKIAAKDFTELIHNLKEEDKSKLLDMIKDKLEESLNNTKNE